MNTPETALARQPARQSAKLGLGALSLITANAGLLLLYFVYDLSLFQLVLVYWWECLWIGLFSALKLIVASIIGDPYENRWATVSRGAAFLTSIVVIGFVSTAFFSVLGVVGIGIMWAYDQFEAPIESLQGFDNITIIIGTSLLFLAGHGISFIANFLVLGEFRHARVASLVALPFKRCLAVGVLVFASITIILFLPQLASKTAFATIVIVLKLAWDMLLHHRERARFAEDFRKADAATS